MMEPLAEGSYFYFIWRLYWFLFISKSSFCC